MILIPRCNLRIYDEKQIEKIVIKDYEKNHKKAIIRREGRKVVLKRKQRNKKKEKK